LKSKSPKATIGKSPRFEKKSPLRTYTQNLPSSYIKDAQQINKKPPKLVSIGKAKRWGDACQTPGVGEYDLTRFKNISRASETYFESAVNQRPLSVQRGGGRREQYFQCFDSQGFR
jgi:hypothetical protein